MNQLDSLEKDELECEEKQLVAQMWMCTARVTMAAVSRDSGLMDLRLRQLHDTDVLIDDVASRRVMVSSQPASRGHCQL